MNIHIPSPLRSYTREGIVEGSGANVDVLLNNLDGNYPGIKFRIVDEQDRIRQHIKIYVNREQIDDLSKTLESTDVVHIICALSGG